MPSLQELHSAADITMAIDEVVEYLQTGDENRQALMHANLLLTNLMRLLRPIAKPARQPDSRSRYGADQAGFGIPKVGALKEAVIRAISQIEHGHHIFRAYWKNAFINMTCSVIRFIKPGRRGS